MPSFIQHPKLDQLNPDAGGGGAVKPPIHALPPDTDEVETDELGYAIVKEKSPDAASKDAKDGGEKKVVAEGSGKKPEDEVRAKTGYEEEPPKVEEPPPAKEEPPVKTDLGYELKVEGLPAEEIKTITEFAKANELSQKAAQAFADFRKSQIKSAEEAKVANEKAQLAERDRIRSGWHKELKTDPQFGGEKFANNLLAAEKVVNEFMPHTKKMLTERGSMLPPYVMRDLVKLSEVLHPTQKLVQGDPPAPEETEEDDPLAFYNQGSKA